MASSAFLDPDQPTESPSCSVCLSRYDDPRVLPCLHTCCRRCLDAHVSARSRFPCPACREDAYLNEGIPLAKHGFPIAFHHLILNLIIIFYLIF